MILAFAWKWEGFFKMLYKVGESVLKKLHSHKGSLKNLVFGSNYKNPKQLFALVCETLKYYAVIQEILKRTKFLKNTRGLSKQLVSLLVYDFLFGKGIQCGGKLKDTVMTRKSMLQSALARIKMERKVAKNEDLAAPGSAVDFPKYMRVNTLKTDLKEVMQALESIDFIEVHKKASLKDHEYAKDEHIKNLLLFNAKLDVHSDPLYLNGHIIFQDKSSCIPAEVLCPSPNSTVIDACAAPGNKTSHLAALMNNTGKIFAFDLNADRIKVMKKMLRRAGVTNCEIKHGDFLKASSSDPQLSKVTHILVDPSCTGSGIIGRLSHLTDNSKSCSESRLQSLSRFQLSVLNHALAFPNVCRVVYSTCSVKEEENELVVKEALNQNPQFSLDKCIPEWKNRGNIVEGLDHDKCLRCCPTLDFCDGFFVAVFKRSETCTVGITTVKKKGHRVKKRSSCAKKFKN